jgi:hypothetical protein
LAEPSTTLRLAQSHLSIASPLKLIGIFAFGFFMIAALKWAESEYDNHQKAKLKAKAGTTEIVGDAGKSLHTARIPIRKENREKGIIGEEGVGAELERIAKEYGLTVLHDLSIPKSKANLDHVLIAKSAIFIVDAKNYAGTIRISKDKNGVKQLYVGRYKQGSLILKMNKYATVFRDFLETENIQVRVVPLLAFYNATFKDGTSFHIDGVAINAAGIENEILKYAAGKGVEIDFDVVVPLIKKNFPVKN